MSGPFGPAIAAGTLFNYTYPPSVTPPASPSSGDTWQEVDANGKLVEEWERVGSNWLSVEESENFEFLALSAASATTNIATGTSMGTWAFRVEASLGASINTDTWSANVRQAAIAANAPVSYVSLQTYNSVAGSLFTFDTGWIILVDTGWINIPITRTGTGRLDGGFSVRRRRVRT